MAVTGTRVVAGRYALGQVLGTGGMATVWRATDQVLDREVAVKILSPQYAADPAFLARFEREARHAARVSHPRLVTVFDCGTAGGTAFIVMELVRGHTLRQALDQAGPLPPGEAVAIAAEVCEALDVAHAAGLVHRDIKPANIALSGGEVKVLDFGIARADDPDGGTRTMGVLGTAAYLSPEQASGGPVGPPSDLYSLGCVLFEMLTGVPPFSADSAVGLAYQHVHDNPGPPSALRPGLPARLDAVTDRLLAKEPEARPASAAAARAMLLTALNRDGTAVLPPAADVGVDAGIAPPGSPWRLRSRVSRAEVALASALAIALIALAAVLLAGLPGHAAPSAGSGGASGQSQAAHRSTRGSSHVPPGHEKHAGKHSDKHAGTALPPVAAAAATFVGDLEAGVANGEVVPSAGQNLYNQLQQLLFEPPGQNAQQVQQQYAQLAQAYEQFVTQGQVTGRAATELRLALRALGTAVGAL